MKNTPIKEAYESWVSWRFRSLPGTDYTRRNPTLDDDDEAPRKSLGDSPHIAKAKKVRRVMPLKGKLIFAGYLHLVASTEQIHIAVYKAAPIDEKSSC